jgi:transcriptional regulator with XRE-family HTH domain
MDEPSDQRLAERLKLLRQQRNLSLDALALQSGISRATLSRMENAEVSPTAQVLGKLCAAYGLTTSRLLYMVESDAPTQLTPKQQPVWHDRKNGFCRRSISPPAPGFAAELLHCELKANTTITYDKLPHEAIEHYFYMLEGALTFSVNGQAFDLQAGDSLRVKLFGETKFVTPKSMGAKYILVVV